MNRHILVITIGLTFALIAPTSALAQITVVGEVSVSSNEIGGTVSNAQLSVDSPGNFVADFSALGETTVSWTWQAPPGTRIEIDAPDGFELVRLFSGFSSGTGVSGPAFTDPTADVTTDLNPSASLRIARVGFGGVGNPQFALFADLDLVPGQLYHLTEITLSTVVPASFDTNFDVPIATFDLRGSAFSALPVDPSLDPGQWVRLVPIPEPASLSLLGVCVLALLGAREMKNNQKGQDSMQESSGATDDICPGG